MVATKSFFAAKDVAEKEELYIRMPKCLPILIFTWIYFSKKWHLHLSENGNSSVPVPLILELVPELGTF